MVELCELGGVLTFVEAVGLGCKREFLSMIVDVVGNGEIHCPAIVDNAYSPKSILGIAPPSKNDFAVECYHAACCMEEDFAAGINKDGD
jgi:hypothetical protein